MSEEISDYKVPYTKILDIQPHTNAERLSVASIYGFQVIVQKDKYQIGNEIIYIPIDSILPENLESILFPSDSKVKLHNRRVRQIRLRGLASQGMVIDPADVASIANPKYFKPEQDLAAILGVTKYQPPEAGPSQTIGKSKQRNKKQDHPLFHKYNGLGNIRWFPDLFKEGDEVVIQCKAHGTNARAARLSFVPNSLWKKIKKFLHLAPKNEYCYGSNNVEISSRTFYKGFYGEDLYGATFQKLNIFSKLKLGETVFGEIIGPNIQKNYDYGLTELKFLLFDVKVLHEDGKQTWLNPEEVALFAKERDLDMVPILYKGPFNKEMAYQLTKGPSMISPTQKVREGIVIKARYNYSVDGNKRALKWISEDYLADQTNSDFH